MADCSSASKKTLKEVLTKKTSAGEIIKDFQKSKNSKFAGKSEEKRKQMALGAYYSMHPEKSKKTNEGFNSGALHGVGSTEMSEDLAVPLLGGSDGDESAEMAKTQLRALANKALHLAMQLGDEQIIEPWVQAKIAVAKDHVSAVHDYMVYGDHSKDKDKEEDEQTAPYDGSIDMTGAPRNTYPDFSVDVNTGRNV
jgi:translation elongation factor EF-G